MDLAKLDLGIHHAAWAVMHMLSGTELGRSDCAVYTAPWYNGRERGFVFSISRDLITFQHIAVFGHRNSDNICALKWVSGGGYLNPPTIASDGDKAYPTDDKYDVAYSVGPDDVGKMSAWVASHMKSFANR